MVVMCVLGSLLLMCMAFFPRAATASAACCLLANAAVWGGPVDGPPAPPSITHYADCNQLVPPQGREVWLVKLAGVDSPEEAALLRGHVLLVPPSARRALEDEDEFYVQVRRAALSCAAQPAALHEVAIYSVARRPALFACMACCGACCALSWPVATKAGRAFT